jgi:transposase
MASTRKKTSDEDRSRIIEAYSNQQKTATIAQILGINRSTVNGVIKIYQKENRITGKKRGGVQTKKLTEGHQDQIRRWVDEDCSLTLRQLKTRCLDQLQVSVSETTINRCLYAFHYSVKRVHLLPVRRNIEETIEQRAIYADMFLQLLSTTEDRKILFLDEVGFSVSLRATRGRAPRGSRAVHEVAALRTRNISVLSVMNKTSILFYSAQTRAYNTETFLASLQQVFEHLAQSEVQNAIFVMDNLSVHKTQAVRQSFTEHGHQTLYLPPYSPFLNPIENMFSKWKTEVRARRPSNESELLTFIENGRDLITGADCEAYYRHMMGFLRRCLNREEIINE